jgi:hypothetical protein
LPISDPCLVRTLARTTPVRGLAQAITPASFATQNAPPPYPVVASIGQT